MRCALHPSRAYRLGQTGYRWRDTRAIPAGGLAARGCQTRVLRGLRAAVRPPGAIPQSPRHRSPGHACSFPSYFHFFIPGYRTRRIARYRPARKLRKILRIFWRTGVVGLYAKMRWRKTQRHGGCELLQPTHLHIEPRLRVRTIPIRPAYTGAQILHAKFAQPFHSEFQSVILIVEPLADP